MGCSLAQCILHNVFDTTKVGLVHAVSPTSSITKDKLVGTVKGLLEAIFGLDLLMQLRKTEIETLAARIRGRVERAGKWIVNIS